MYIVFFNHIFFLILLNFYTIFFINNYLENIKKFNFVKMFNNNLNKFNYR